VEKCHFPQLRQTVDKIASGTITLLKQYLVALEAQESQPIDPTIGSSLGKLLRSIDRIIWDLQHPSQVVRAKWQQLTEKIELMERTIVKFTKAKESQRDLEIERVNWKMRLMSERGLTNAGVKQLKDYHTLLKLYCVIARKISEPTTSERLFLMSEMDVKELCELFFKIEIVERKLKGFASDVSDVYERRCVKDFSCFYNNFNTLILSMHRYTFHTTGDPIEPFQRFLAWYCMWRDLHKTAFQNFLDSHIVTGTL